MRFGVHEPFNKPTLRTRKLPFICVNNEKKVNSVMGGGGGGAPSKEKKGDQQGPITTVTVVYRSGELIEFSCVGPPKRANIYWCCDTIDINTRK